MPYSLGKVAYVNSLPLFCGGGFDDFAVCSAAPCVLNSLVAQGKLHAAMISRWVYESCAAKDYEVLGNYGIFGDGEIMSVKIFSKIPFKKFADASIYITPETGTSSRAFAMLFRRRYGVDIFALPRAPLESADAALLIGDAALLFAPYEFCADLGEMWKSETGLPMMYSVFVARRDVAAEMEKILPPLLRNSLDKFSNDRSAVIAEAAESLSRAGKGRSPEFVSKYYSRLIYRLPRETFKKTFDFIAKNARA